MKKIITILVLAFSFVATAQTTQIDSVSISLDIVEKGFYTVFIDDTQISRHSKPMKAVSKANELRLKYPLADIKVTQPNLVPEGALNIYAKSNPCIENNESITRIKTNEESLIFEFPDDDTDLFTIINLKKIELIVGGVSYKDKYQITWKKSNNQWIILN